MLAMTVRRIPLRRSFLLRVTWAFFVICLFVVLTGVGIVTRLPDGNLDNRTGTATRIAIAGPRTSELDRVTVRETVREMVRGEDMNDLTSSNVENFFENGSDVWQQANPSWKDYKLLVYSAYWDNRTNPFCVRVIGATLTKNSPPVMCKLLFSDGQSTEMTAHKKPLNEHWNLKYAGFIFSCCSSNFGPLVPNFVSIFEKSARNISSTLPVHSSGSMNESNKNIALCVKPFHYDFNRAVWLLEFIEFYRMMGVEHFLFYNDSVGVDVQDVLVYYKNKSVVSVLPWKMHVKNQKEIRTENMFAALNDCVYRLMYKYKYVVSVDIDEFIVPKQHKSFTDMLASFTVGKQGHSCASSYVFQNAFFYLYWENDTALFGTEPETSPRHVPYLLTQYKTRRLETPHNHGKRSKYIVVPEKTVEAGNHITWRHIENCKPAKVPYSVALLHHYRICEFGGFECLKLASTIDRSAHRFGLQVLNEVLQRCERIFTRYGGQCPPSPPLGSPW